ncbi:MAG: DUF1844 domain-containing protein [Acidobacteria bacterium]|nr:MAG: DUF1844 domain-containing protein [Acidobacteriota bacterium]
MANNDKDQESGFKITDRRLFTEEGEPRPEAQRPPSPQPQREKSAESRTQAPPPRPAPRPRPQDQTRPGKQAPGEEELSIDFPSFLLSMATSAMVHMGEVADPATGRPAENLQAARQTIDILTILREKTQGNLSAEEQRLLDGLLYELRLKFLNKSKVIKF